MFSLMKAKYLPSIDDHLDWIKSLARNVSRKTVDPSIGWEDLQQEGLIAVCEALRKGRPHVAFLKMKARWAMMDAMRRTNFLPSNRVRLIREVEKAQVEFGNVNHRSATTKELEKIVKRSDVERSLVARENSRSLITACVDDGRGSSTESYDVLEYVDRLQPIQRELITRRVLRGERWRDVIEVMKLERSFAFRQFNLALDTLKGMLCEA